jgi:hypothetical protein
MKTLLLYLVIMLFPVCITAQTIVEQDEKLMDDYIKKNLTSGKTTVDPLAVGKIFSGSFYIVSPGFKQPEGIGYCSDYFFNINAGVLVEYEQLTTDKELPVLLSLVKKGFILKDEAGAKLFEASLNELYPVKDSDKPGVKHMKKNNQWIFLRGKFFDDQTAVIVNTDAKGTITRFELKLSYTGV